MRVEVIFFIILLSCAKVSAQDYRYSVSRLTENEGLPQDFVYDVLQDSKGYLWISTGAGFSRFDGKTIKNFSQKDGLAGDFVTQSFLTSQGELYTGHFQGGISRFSGFDFKILIKDTLRSKVVAFAEDTQGNIWFATKSHGLGTITEDGRITYQEVSKLNDRLINDMIITNNKLFIATNEGLITLTITGIKPMFSTDIEDLAYVNVTSLTPSLFNLSKIWVGTEGSGIYKLSDDSELAVKQFITHDFTTNQITDIAEDRNYDLWVSTNEGGLMFLNLTHDQNSIITNTIFNESNGFYSNSVISLTIDRQNTLWATSAGKGLMSVNSKLFTFIETGESLGAHYLHSIAEGIKGNYYIASDNGVVLIKRNKGTGEYQAEQLTYFNKKPIRIIYKDGSGKIWIATRDYGVFIYDELKNSVAPIKIMDGHERVLAMEQSAKGTLWLAIGGEGVIELDEDRNIVRHLSTTTGFYHNEVTSIHCEANGNVWFGSHGAGLAMMDKENGFHFFSQQDVFPSKDVNDISQDESGTIWIATDGEGYFSFDGSNFKSFHSFLGNSSGYISSINSDRGGAIWYTFRKGVGMFDEATSKTHLFKETEGLIKSESYSTKIFVDSERSIWIGNDNGVTVIEQSNKPPKGLDLVTFINGLKIFNRDYHLMDTSFLEKKMGELPPVTLQHDQNHVLFLFSAIDLTYPENVRYKYFLKGYDKDWSPETGQGTATYTNLDPGDYTMMIQASDDPNIWKDPITSYSFIISKPYWNEAWFYALQIFIFIGLFGITYALSKSRSANHRIIIRLLVYSCLFIAFEYIHSLFEPITSTFMGGVPVYKTLANLVLALILFPIEVIAEKLFHFKKGVTNKQLGEANHK